MVSAGSDFSQSTQAVPKGLNLGLKILNWTPEPERLQKTQTGLLLLLVFILLLAECVVVFSSVVSPPASTFGSYISSVKPGFAIVLGFRSRKSSTIGISIYGKPKNRFHFIWAGDLGFWKGTPVLLGVS